jgi:hypothetical protein
MFRFVLFFFGRFRPAESRYPIPCRAKETCAGQSLVGKFWLLPSHHACDRSALEETILRTHRLGSDAANVFVPLLGLAPSPDPKYSIVGLYPHVCCGATSATVKQKLNQKQTQQLFYCYVAFLLDVQAKLDSAVSELYRGSRVAWIVDPSLDQLSLTVMGIKLIDILSLLVCTPTADIKAIDPPHKHTQVLFDSLSEGNTISKDGIEKYYLGVGAVEVFGKEVPPDVQQMYSSVSTRKVTVQAALDQYRRTNDLGHYSESTMREVLGVMLNPWDITKVEQPSGTRTVKFSAANMVTSRLSFLIPVRNIVKKKKKVFDALDCVALVAAAAVKRSPSVFSDCEACALLQCHNQFLVNV